MLCRPRWDEFQVEVPDMAEFMTYRHVMESIHRQYLSIMTGLELEATKARARARARNPVEKAKGKS